MLRQRRTTAGQNAALDAWHAREEETVGPRRRVCPRIKILDKEVRNLYAAREFGVYLIKK